MDFEKKILLIEDDEAMITLIRDIVAAEAFEVESVRSGAEGLERAAEDRYALVVVDVNLPTIGGFEVCRRLREINKVVSILMVTSRAEEVDRVLGLELGADDYMTKPFHPRELLARIRVLIRRFEKLSRVPCAPPVLNRISVDELEIDTEKREVFLSAKKVPLTAVEYELLLYLAERSGKVVSRSELLMALWGDTSLNLDATVSVHLSRLRGKIEPNPAIPRFLHTVRGVGYSFRGSTVED